MQRPQNLRLWNQVFKKKALEDWGSHPRVHIPLQIQILLQGLLEEIKSFYKYLFPLEALKVQVWCTLKRNEMNDAFACVIVLGCRISTLSFIFSFGNIILRWHTYLVLVSAALQLSKVFLLYTGVFRMELWGVIKMWHFSPASLCDGANKPIKKSHLWRKQIHWVWNSDSRKSWNILTDHEGRPSKL